MQNLGSPFTGVSSTPLHTLVLPSPDLGFAAHQPILNFRKAYTLFQHTPLLEAPTLSLNGEVACVAAVDRYRYWHYLGDHINRSVATNPIQEYHYRVFGKDYSYQVIILQPSHVLTIRTLLLTFVPSCSTQMRGRHCLRMQVLAGLSLPPSTMMALSYGTLQTVLVGTVWMLGQAEYGPLMLSSWQAHLP